MHITNVLALSLPILGALAAPAKVANGDCRPWTRTSTTTAVTASTTTATSSTSTKSSSSSSTSSGALTFPTEAYTVISARSGSPIHLLPMNAAGQAFYLGGSPATYCPESVTTCPAGDVTAFLGTTSLDTEVPGGQQIYVAPDGHLGFTQAHSASYPTGADLSGFTYIKDAGSQFGVIGTNAFNATGFMACPTNATAGASSSWQVFAAFPGAKVPSGNVADCLGFDGLTTDFNSTLPAAWQYT